MKVLATVFQVISITFAVLSIVVWIRNPTRFPRYIHVLAFGAFLLGLFFTLGGEGWFFVLLFPGIVYVFFIALGGGGAPRAEKVCRATQQQAETNSKFVQQEPERFSDDSKGRDVNDRGHR